MNHPMGIIVTKFILCMKNRYSSTIPLKSEITKLEINTPCGILLIFLINSSEEGGFLVI